MVEQLGRDIRDMQVLFNLIPKAISQEVAARRPPSSPSSTDESETAIRYNLVIPPVIPDHRPAPQLQ